MQNFERIYVKDKDILLKIVSFWKQHQQSLSEKETLLHSDIKAIRDSINLVEVAI